MAKLIRNIGNGKSAYIGLLTPEELEEADKIQNELKKIIPTLEKTLQEKYPKRGQKVFYAYEFGLELRKLIKKFDVKGYQEKVFWDQIRDFASMDKNRAQDRGENRRIYDYYYKLSQFKLDDVKNINWSEWSQLFDTPGVIQDDRIINWLVSKARTQKFKREHFRELLTGIRLFFKDKDSFVYTDEQLFEKYETINLITVKRIELFNFYFTSQNKKPTEARTKRPKKYQEMYFKKVFEGQRRNKNTIIEEIIENVFKEVYLVSE